MRSPRSGEVRRRRSSMSEDAGDRGIREHAGGTFESSGARRIALEHWRYGVAGRISGDDRLAVAAPALMRINRQGAVIAHNKGSGTGEGADTCSDSTCVDHVIEGVAVRIRPVGRAATLRLSSSAGMARGVTGPDVVDGRNADRRQRRSLPPLASRRPTGLRTHRRQPADT